MKSLRLERRFTANGAVIGVLTGLSKTLYVLEDEWRSNQTGNSCIPTGTYQVKPHGWEPNTTVKFKRVWELQNVPGRSAILMHAGNTKADTEGCLLCGFGFTMTETMSMVTRSAFAIELMRAELGQEPFTLTIVG